MALLFRTGLITSGKMGRHRWSRPSLGFVKCNSDASLFTLSQTLGLKVAYEAEAIVLRQAILWVQSLGYSKMILEMDCEHVVDALNSSSCGISDFDIFNS
ncbi:conserved hypothetical protein [Ricinus communis]|uniref:RNase H type-1 domain-containing protein n=1 Tax=Ricinus communis TaxID=3988 RepID=B9SD81_RICCO|nr:conserved hypothetical protein [Ricinus communis]